MKLQKITRIGLLGLLMLVLATPAAGFSTEVETDVTGMVWICGGPKSKRYHSHKDCPGLRRCSKTPRKIALSEAKERGYTPCRKCCN